MDRNVTGSFNLIRLLAKEMIRNPRNEGGERGVIINTSRYVIVRDSRIQHCRCERFRGDDRLLVCHGSSIGDDASSRPIPRSLRNPMCRHPARTLRHSRNTRLRRHGQRSRQNDAVPEETGRSGGVRAAGGGKSDEEGERETIISNEMLNGCNIRLDGGIRSFPVCSIP